MVDKKSKLQSLNSKIEKKELRILMLEDNPADAELIESELNTGGIAFTSKRVETREAFLKEIKNFAPDLILADYSLPSFDGLSALSIAQEKCPDVPVIIVSGVIGEYFAIETLKKGATDYVLKDRLSRLVPAVNRALRESNERAERRRAENALLESEERFNQVSDNAEEWIWEVDANGLYTYSSSVVEKILGYKPEEIIGKKYFYDFFVPDLREELKKTAFEFFSRKESFTKLINPNLHKNCQVVIMETNGVPVLDDKGNLLGYRGADTDITERKQTEKALLESEEKYRMLFDKALDGIALADVETGILLDCNQSLADLVGRNRAELIGQHQSILHPSSSNTTGLSQTFKQHLTNQEGQILETQVLTATGEIREVEIKANLLYIQGRKMLQGIFRDITERKQAEEKLNHLLEILRKAKEEWEMTFDNVMELIVIIDKELRIIRCNKSFTEFAGMPGNELTGKKCYDFFSCDYKQIGNCMLRSQTGEFSYKNEIETEPGRWFYESNCPIMDEKGNFLYSVVVATDITDLKNSQRDFIQAHEELKNRIKALEDFSNMAVGREIRMVELKEEIEQLKEELGKYKKDD